MLPDADLVEDTRTALDALVSDFGFAEPEAERLNHELHVRFHRGGETIAVLFNSVDPPMIELFLPVEGTRNAALSWAERNGVPRYRRFPTVVVAESWDASDRDVVRKYLGALAVAFFAAERKFLEEHSERHKR